MLKVIDPIRWEAAKAIFAASFAGAPEIGSRNSCHLVDDIVNEAIYRGWLAEVPDAPAAPDPAAGWRPIHEAYGRTDFLCVGGWFMDEWCWSRHDYTQAVTYGYTHFMDLPYPERKP